MNTWTIGRSLECDVNIDHDDVAGRHCVLYQTAGGFLLADLGSKNGTFVDQQRIAHPVVLTPDSQITLGTSVPFVWPAGLDRQAIWKACEVAEAELFRIGRFADNDLVLDRAMISGRHAVLVIERDRIVLEDLDSTNGTAVGKIDNKIQSAEVKERDRVFFGSFSILVTHLLSMARTPRPPETVVEPPVKLSPKTTNAKSNSKRRWLAAAALLAVATTAMAFWPKGSDDRQTLELGSTEPRSTLPAGEGQSTPAMSEASRSDEPLQPDLKANLLAPLQDQPSSEPIAISEAADSLFLVIVTGDSKQVAFHIGTAWLAAPDRLVTSGTVVSSIEEQQASGFSNVQVVQSSSGIVFDVAAFELDAGLAEAQRKYALGRQQYSELQAEIQALRIQGDSAMQRLEEARRESQAIIEAGLKSTSVRAGLNLGWLKLLEPVPAAKPAVLDAAAEIAVGDRLHMHAAPFQIENPAWDPASAAEPHGVVVQVEQRIPSTAPQTPDRWVMSMNTSGPLKNYIGSPILTRQGEIVAMYSRPLADQSMSTGIATVLFEAVSVQRIEPAESFID